MTDVSTTSESSEELSSDDGIYVSGLGSDRLVLSWLGHLPCNVVFLISCLHSCLDVGETGDTVG